MDAETKVLTQHFTVGKLFRYVMPTIFATLLASLYSIVDGIFVSNFGGTTAFAAVNQMAPICMIIAAIGFMFGTGGSALIGKILGEGDKKRANGLFSFLTYALIVIGIAASVVLMFTIEPLCRALGVTETMMPFCLAYGRILIPALTLFMLQFYFQSFLVTAKKPRLGLLFTIIAGVVNTVGDAILVGVGTVLADDPHLTVKGATYEENPIRIVIDPHGRTPHEALVVNDAAPTIILTDDYCEKTWDNADVIRCGTPLDLELAMDALAKAGIENILVEGGGETIASFFRKGMVDRYTVFVGSMIIGGRISPTPVDGDGWIAEGGIGLELKNSEVLGNGVLLTYSTIQ